MTDFYVKHFIEAHEATVVDALTELRKGKKQSHWMWFIFPIINGLSQSYMGTYYAIGSVAKASAFVNHKYQVQITNNASKQSSKTNTKLASKFYRRQC